MSRIGKQPVVVPDGVSVDISKGNLKVKGPKGTLDCACPEKITVKQEDGKLIIERADDDKPTRALHGLIRSLLNNMVTGVSKGFQRELEIVGVGYRAQVQGQRITFALGYSKPVEFDMPEGITAKVDQKQTRLTLEGIDKQQIGQVAANIRALRPPDSYKGKGVRYAGEYIKFKAGKAGKK